MARHRDPATGQFAVGEPPVNGRPVALAVEQAARPGPGPHDGDAMDPDAELDDGTTDFGALRVPLPPGGAVMVEPPGAGGTHALHITLPAGRLSVSALAAPKSSRLWPELAKEIETSLREGGARVRSFTGDWGRELHATTGAATSVFVGVDGPRWMLYGVATGPTATLVPLDEELRRMLRGTVVMRGAAPYPVRTVLPLTLPAHLAPPAEPEPAATTNAGPSDVEVSGPPAPTDRAGGDAPVGRPGATGGPDPFGAAPQAPAGPQPAAAAHPAPHTPAVAPVPAAQWRPSPYPGAPTPGRNGPTVGGRPPVLSGGAPPPVGPEPRSGAAGPADPELAATDRLPVVPPVRRGGFFEEAPTRPLGIIVPPSTGRAAPGLGAGPGWAESRRGRGELGRGEVGGGEPSLHEPRHVEPGRVELGRGEPGRGHRESSREEPSFGEWGRVEPGLVESGRDEPGRGGRDRVEPGRLESGRGEPSFGEWGRVEPGLVESGRDEPGRGERGRVEPGRLESGREPGFGESGRAGSGWGGVGGGELGRLEPDRLDPGRGEPGSDESSRAGSGWSEVGRGELGRFESGRGEPGHGDAGRALTGRVAPGRADPAARDAQTPPGEPNWFDRSAARPTPSRPTPPPDLTGPPTASPEPPSDRPGPLGIDPPRSAPFDRPSASIGGSDTSTPAPSPAGGWPPPELADEVSAPVTDTGSGWPYTAPPVDEPGAGNAEAERSAEAEPQDEGQAQELGWPYSAGDLRPRSDRGDHRGIAGWPDLPAADPSDQPERPVPRRRRRAAPPSPTGPRHAAPTPPRSSADEPDRRPEHVQLQRDLPSGTRSDAAQPDGARSYQPEPPEREEPRPTESSLGGSRLGGFQPHESQPAGSAPVDGRPTPGRSTEPPAPEVFRTSSSERPVPATSSFTPSNGASSRDVEHSDRHRDHQEEPRAIGHRRIPRLPGPRPSPERDENWAAPKPAADSDGAVRRRTSAGEPQPGVSSSGGAGRHAAPNPGDVRRTVEPPGRRDPAPPLDADPPPAADPTGPRTTDPTGPRTTGPTGPRTTGPTGPRTDDAPRSTGRHRRPG